MVLISLIAIGIFYYLSKTKKKAAEKAVFDGVPDSVALTQEGQEFTNNFSDPNNFAQAPGVPRGPNYSYNPNVIKAEPVDPDEISVVEVEVKPKTDRSQL